jgi:hypothetical protein
MRSVNVTPSITLGNWFAPFSLRHFFEAAVSNGLQRRSQAVAQTA